MADDMAWGDLGIHGNSVLDTPILDEMAKSGVRLDRFYVSPASAPTSASLLTGRHCLSTGVIGDNQGTHLLHENEITFAEILQSDGYTTGYFGDWHHGANPPHDAKSQGFDTVGQADDWGEFMAENMDKPFCAFLAAPSFLELGSVEEAQAQKYRDKELSEDLSVLYAGIEALDRRCGDIFDQLKELDLTRHTLVLVLSDCGPEAVEGRFNSGLYGTQGSLHEGGLRVPAIWSWQGVIPQGAIVHRICHHTDVFATLLGVAGAPIPNDRAIHGLNIAPLLLFGDDARWPNRNLGSVLVPGRDLDGASRSYRTTRWAAVLDPDWRRVEPGPEDERWELYDLMADPRQHYNVAGAYPFVWAGLKSDIAHWFHKSQVFGYPVIPSVLESTPIRLDPRSAVYPARWEGPKPLDRVKGWDEAGFSASWPIVYRRSGKVR
ncbi:MAG: sulfatase-like hydrolase/transferase, partial [Verrucomicrobiota bacterium]